MTFFDISRIVCLVGYLALFFRDDGKLNLNNIILAVVLSFSGWIGFVLLITISVMYKSTRFKKAIITNKYKRK